MSRPRALETEERARLLSDLCRLSSSADGDRSQMDRLFLPLSRHERALHPHTLVVRGERGAGKTALFQFVEDMKDKNEALRELFPNAQLPERVRWVDGFSEAMPHPSTALLDAFGPSVDDETLRVFWATHLACVLHRQGLAPQSVRPPDVLVDAWTKLEPEKWVALGREHLPVLSRFLDQVEALLALQETTLFVAYDHLDRIGLFTPGVRERFAGTLLALWLSLSTRYTRLRPKIFVRQDLFEAASEAFPDASKLGPRSVSLDWDTESLYRVLIRHMAQLSPEMRDWIQATSRGILLQEHPQLGWLPPSSLPEEGKPSQKAFVDHLAGEQMGTGIKKGYTYRWIPNRLQDAHRRMVPRSILNLIAQAAERALPNPKAGHHRLLTPGNLSDALEATSSLRVKELTTEHKVVARLAQLASQAVLLPEATVVRALAKRPAGTEDDGFEDDGKAVVRELLRLGVLTRRSDGRIDVPDIYRHGFHIKRKGGVARPR